ncbi:MAG: hypothetical protein IJT35_07875 [Paludibacteraceae bacterium]|nr:hypothetical protein [Paludibacteraceae bacterium]
MKKILFVASIALALISCSTQKTATASQEQEVIVPCSEFKTDKQAIRASATASSPNMQIAKEKALAAARAELATSAQVFVRRVTERYVASYDVNQNADAKGLYQDMSRQLASRLLENSSIVCDKTTKTTDKKGNVQYHSYVAVEMAKQDVAKEMEKRLEEIIRKDDKAQIDLDVEKFRKIFEQELENK